MSEFVLLLLLLFVLEGMIRAGRATDHLARRTEYRNNVTLRRR